MSYYINEAQKVRLNASISSLQIFLDDLNSVSEGGYAEFDPTVFLQRLENLELEVSFVHQFVANAFLASDGNAEWATDAKLPEPTDRPFLLEE